MDIFILSDYIVEIYKLPEYISSKRKFLTKDIILTLLYFDNIRESASFLGISDSAMEHLIERNLKPWILDPKPRQQTWKAFFLSLFDLKKCSACLEVKEIEDFGLDTSRSSKLLSRCRSCENSRSITYKNSNRDIVRSSLREHYYNNKDYYLYRNALRRAKKKQATPIWADLIKVKEIYLNRPSNMHVDHIYPLDSTWVCGLHNEFNLQYLSPEENKKKSNKNIGQ